MSNDKKRTERRRILREKGLCLDCESPELATNKDGTRSRYCDRHLAIHSTAGRTKNSKPVIKRPAALEIDEDGNPLPFGETKAGKAHQVLVRDAVKKLGKRRVDGEIVYTRVTYGQIKRHLGDKYNKHTWATLETLVGGHLLEWRQMGASWSWVYVEPPAEKPITYMGKTTRCINITPPSERDRPDPSSFGMEITI